jgi:hypothetical protein
MDTRIQVVLVGTCGEVARVALAAGIGQPTWPECLHDWDLSHAAAAASKALSASSASFAHHDHPPVNLALPSLRGALPPIHTVSLHVICNAGCACVQV